jgi:hypothetical protein
MEYRHTNAAVRAAEIITGGKYGDKDTYPTEWGRKTVEGIADLIENQIKADKEGALRLAVEAGLAFADCVAAFGVPKDEDPHARAVVEREGELEVDDITVISHSWDGGAYVMAWAWVPDECAGTADFDDEGEV